MKSLTTTVARILFAAPFGVFGLIHLGSGPQMANYVPSFIPGGVFWIYLTGLAMLGASISMIIKKFAKLSSFLLAVMLGIFILTIHIPGLGNEATMQMSLTNLLKDLGLAAGALTWSGIFAQEESAGAAG